MTEPGAIVDQATYRRSVARFREADIRLPTFAELADPATIAPAVLESLNGVDPDAADPRNLFRVHWFNAADRRTQVDVPGYIELPSSLTGVPARIVLALGERFPMITAHKVLAAYACLAPQLVSGRFDPTAHRAVWPSTGNYCRGGVAISRIMRCRGVAVLPEGMSAERFEWLAQWVGDPADVIRTPGSESNVKEIYDACAELERDPANVIFNQFSEYANHLVHYACTGRALATVFEDVAARSKTRPTLAAFTSATGSGGSIAAGDYLKDRYGALVVAAEAVECPTLLRNGFGEHNIQGIGDKHVPLVHNVMNTDVVTAISDHATDGLFVLFNTDVGRRYLTERRGVDPALVARLGSLGLSSICNVLAAIKTAKHFDLGPDSVLVTVATDGASLYGSEQQRLLAERWPGGFDAVSAGEAFGQYLLGASTGEMRELGYRERERIFNLGYYTWVEQQGVDVKAFQARRSQGFWIGLRDQLAGWDDQIAAFNAEAGHA